MVNHRILTILFTICFGSLVGQINYNMIPESKKQRLESVLNKVKIENTKQISPKPSKYSPPQAGYTIPLQKEINNSGKWNKTKDGYVWRISLKVTGAESLNLYFRNINLQENEEIFVYGPSYNNIQSIVKIEKRNVCTDFILGDEIIIEFNSTSHYKVLPFTINEVGVLLADTDRGFGDAGICEVHVNCSEGSSWQDEKKGIARILVKEGSLTFWCTGSLINNTNNDGTPLFLTANHCGEDADSTDYSEWLFYFNFESESCGQPVFQPEHNTISGSTLLAKSKLETFNGSDFKLLRLAQEVPLDFTPYYNGWDRSNQSSSSGVTIHHPQGDVKMISTYTQSLTSTKYDNTSPNQEGEYWMVYWAETTNGHGVTEGGSSGSPIFNNDGNIIGALTGGRASCSYENQPDFYGKLSYSWDTDLTDSTTNLMYWLDPLSTGTEKLKGTNLDSTNIFAGFSADPKSILVGESVEIINSSYGNISNYSWYFEGGNPEYSELEYPGYIRYDQAGDFNVRLIVSSADASDTLIAENYIKVLPNLSPNPSKGKVRLSFGGSVPNGYSIRVFNVYGQETAFKIDESGDNYIIIDLMPVSDGNHIISFSSPEINTTYKAVVIKN